MADNDDIRTLLEEIRDNQRRALEKQEEHLDIARRQLDRSNQQIEESLGLQRQAIDRARSAFRIAVPGIAICIGLIIILLLRYF